MVLKNKKYKHEKIDFRLKVLCVPTILLIFALFIICVAFAYVTGEDLEVEGKAQAQAQEGIFITRMELAGSVNANISNSNINYFISSIVSSTIELGNTLDSSITYSGTIHNSNNSEYLFLGAIYNDDSKFYDNTNIEYVVNDMIPYESVIEPNGDINFSITFKYKEGVDLSNNILNSYINFKFRKALKITFDENYEEGKENIIKITAEGWKMPELKVPQRDGYKFLGWYDNEDYSKGTQYYDKDGKAIEENYNKDEDIILYARWEAIKYTIVFNKNAEDITETIENQNVEYDIAVTLNENKYSRVGYLFDGWNTKADGTGESYNDKQIVKNITKKDGEKFNLYAKWKPIKYTIIFNKNAEDATGVMKNQEFEYDQKLRLNDNQYIRNGYVMKEWNTKADGTGISYKNKQEIINLSKDEGDEINLYIIWKQITVDNVTGNGLNIIAEWKEDNVIDFSLNGKSTSKLYIRIVEKDILISTTPAKLYKKEYADNPIFKSGDNVFIQYDYLDGDESKINNTFTLKYRDTSTSCLALNTAELIANHSKQNFKLNSSFKNTGVLDNDVSVLSMFIENGCEFNNFKFRVTFGIE